MARDDRAVGAGSLILVLGLLGILWWTWRAAPAAHPDPAPNADRAQQGQADAEPPAPSREAAAAASERPAHLSEAQWLQLRQALQDHPRREAEIRRVSDYLLMQSRVQAFVQARERGAPKTELAALARPLQQDLPGHLARGELAGAEALRLQAALLQATESSPEAARVALAVWRERWLQPSSTDPRDAAFQREQQALLARWQAGGGRDPQALERELDALRVRHYDAP